MDAKQLLKKNTIILIKKADKSFTIVILDMGGSPKLPESLHPSRGRVPGRQGFWSEPHIQHYSTRTQQPETNPANLLNDMEKVL